MFKHENVCIRFDKIDWKFYGRKDTSIIFEMRYFHFNRKGNEQNIKMLIADNILVIVCAFVIWILDE